MLKASTVLLAGSYADPVDAVTLDHDGRHRRRIALTGNGGLSFLLDLPEAVALRHGDGLLLEDGRVVAVEAAPEPLTQVTAADPHHLLRLAWHLGNRHLPAMIEDGRILIRRDHVISDMVRGLGGEVTDIEAPFDPEGGAYGGHSHAHSHSETHSHAHSHSETHSHTHSHSHGHGHSHSHSHSHAHAHGAGEGHEH
ncbi:urease accessory protein UreE [Amorphus sp. 3PC139-8]|uniref:urease accessory protein UreE n=1 Tax=Amorphus sp. 3PC139-8 TaxID=2735676 RepID=UPI00345DF386